MVEAVFVQGTDHNYYRNPIVYGDNWFVEFEDEELPQIVVKNFKKTSNSSCEKRMRKILNSHGFKYKLDDGFVSGTRVFPPKFQGFVPAIARHFQLKDLIPVNDIEIHHEGCLILKPEADGTYFTFFDPFDIEEIDNLIAGKPTQKIITWLTGLNNMSPQSIKSARNELFKQHPGHTIGKDLLYLRRKIR